MRSIYFKGICLALLGLFSGTAGAQSLLNIDGGAKFVMTGAVKAYLDGGTDLKTSTSQIVMDEGTLIINGNNQGTGNIKSSPASSLIIGGAGGTIKFDQTSAVTRSLKDLTLNAGATVTLGTALDIAAGSAPGTVIVNSGATLNTGNNLTLRSDANGTARVGQSAGTINGEASVERYINAASVSRKWHLLSGVATSGSQNILNSWQEGGGAAVANMGTWVTSNGYTGSNGYDGPSVSGSILKHNPAVPSWESLAATNSGAISSEQGYMVFVRGDRFALPGNAFQDNTVLRTKGSLKQGTQPAITILNSSPAFTLIGNPYASPIDLEGILNRTTDLDNNFLVWDASVVVGTTYGLGKFRAVQKTGAGTYTATPVSANDNSLRYIHSGQAFFLRTTTTNSNNASLQIVETDKTASLSVVNPLVPVAGDQQIYTELVTVNPGNIESVADGVRIWYNAGFDAGTNDDIVKLGNFGENLSSYRSGKKLIVEMRPMIGSRDTIFLRSSNLAMKDYRLKINTFDFVQPNVQAFLEDAYLNGSSPLNLNGSVNSFDFSVTTDPASASPDRFIIVFAASGPLPVTFTTLQAQQQGQFIDVNWKVSNQLNIEKYEVEKSANGTSFSKVKTQAAVGANGSDATYAWLDLNPVTGDNFYRIRSIGNGGDVKISKVVKVWMGKGLPAITVYPNPVTNRNIALQFTDMAAGVYRLRLMNNLGQPLFTKTITHVGGSAAQAVMLDKNIAAGNYQLEIIKPDHTKTSTTLLITE